MNDQPVRHVRVRVNVSRTSRGLFSYDATCELTEQVEANEDFLGRSVREHVLKESDALMAELAERYPLEEALK
jgi:hypothetical protein